MTLAVTRARSNLTPHGFRTDSWTILGCREGVVGTQRDHPTSHPEELAAKGLLLDKSRTSDLFALYKRRDYSLSAETRSHGMADQIDEMFQE